MRSSWAVTSKGVPKVVMVEKKLAEIPLFLINQRRKFGMLKRGPRHAIGFLTVAPPVWGPRLTSLPIRTLVFMEKRGLRDGSFFEVGQVFITSLG